LNALRKLLATGDSSTQEDLVEALHSQKYSVTQSTISRDLRRLGAIKAQDSSGRTVYRLPDDPSVASFVPSPGLKGLLIDIQHNGAMIVLHTTPGSASLVARHLDQTKPEGILGTIAGDDTIFVVPASMKKIIETVQAIVSELS
jgi:transcriptional regulator of arginine metabolism